MRAPIRRGGSADCRRDDPVAATSQASSASERAVASGEPVEYVARRTAYPTTVANPDGTFTQTQSTTPQRVKKADGSWTGIDVDLVRRADGSVGPKAAAVGASFSGGGEAGEMTLRWGLGDSERTKISSDGDKFWQFTEDKGVGLCGNADGYFCGSGYIDRTYFEFAPTKLSGKH